MSSTDPVALAPGLRAWHCAALHRIGIAFVLLARRLDALSRQSLAWEQVRARLAASDEHLLDIRHRIYTRYY